MANSGGYIPVLDPRQEASEAGIDYQPLFADAADIKLRDMNTLAERKQNNLQNTIVGKLGLDANSLAGQYVNLQASLASGISRTAGYVATAPINVISGMSQGSVPEAQIEAYNRAKTGQIQEGDDALLDADAPVGEDGIPQTFRERLEATQGLQDVSKKVADFFDVSSIVDTTRRDRLGDDLGDSTASGIANLRAAREDFKNSDYLSALKKGAAGLASTVGNAIKTGAGDPGAVAEYAIENLPQLAAAALPGGAIVTNSGYGLDAYRQGITEYAEENQGQIPKAADRAEMAAFAASATLAEQFSDISALRGFKNTGRSIGAGVGSTVAAGVREGLTEGYQTYAEARAKLKDATLEEIVEAGTIGAFVGSTYQGTAATGSRIRGKAEDTVASIDRNAAETELFDTATKTGDVSALAEVNPVRAIQALGEIARDADQATKDSAIKQADDVQKSINTRLSSVQARMDYYSEAGIQELKEERQLAERAGATEAQLKMYDSAIEAGQKYTPEQRKSDENLAASLEKQANEVRQASERLFVDSTPDVEALADQAVAGDTQAADRVLTLTMTNPDAVSSELANRLTNSESLTPEQRDAIEKFDIAQTTSNAFKDRKGVQSDVINGGKGFKGLNQYRNTVRMALNDGNVEAAQAQVDNLAGFAETRRSKAKAIAEAFAEVQGTNKSIYVAPNEQGEWVQVPDRKPNGLVISPASGRLLADVQAEADVLTTATEAYQALVTANPKLPEVQAAPVQEEVTPATETTTNETAPTVEPVVADAVSDVDTAVDDTKQSTTEESAPVVEETGELTAVKNRTGEQVTSDNYRNVNLLGELFSQSKSNDTDTSVRPLVAVKDFASALRTGKVRLQDFLADKGPLTGPKRQAMVAFFGFNKSVDGHITKGFSRLRDPAFRYQDYSQFLINEDGSVDENVKTAIAFGMFTWLSENAANLVNSPEGINMILGRKADSPVSRDAYNLLGRVGTREDVIANQVGARIVQALGLKAGKDTASNELARLESAIGIKAIGAMTSAGLIERTEISDKDLKAVSKSRDAVTSDVHTFLNVTTEQVNGLDVANEVTRKIREATTGSQSVINKLFSVDAAGVEPSYVPVPFDQAFAKRSGQLIPKGLAETLDKEGHKALTIRQDVNQIWGILSKNGRYRAAGVVDTDTKPAHKANLLSREAKNNGLRSQVDNYDTFLDKMISDESTDGIDQKLYFGRSVWKIQRVGLSTNIINPQTSKVHRHLLAMEGWETEINTADKEQMDNFKLRVLEAFDKKTESRPTDLVLADYDSVINVPVVNKAVALIAELLRGDATNPDENVILDAIEYGKANMHTLDALVSLAHMANAVDGKFKTTFMGEVDGVTNGPMLSLLMLGAKDFDTLNRGGFFKLGQTDSRGNTLTQFNDYKGTPGNLDLYESTVAGVLERLGFSRNLSALEVITGQLRTDEGNVSSKGRNIIKQPLTAMMFGSNTATAVLDMAQGFVDSIYDKMEDIAAKGDEKAMIDLLNAVNTLMGSKKDSLDANKGISVAMETVLTDKQEKLLRDEFHALIGQHAEASLNDNYAVFLARRDTVNQTAQLAFRLYNAAYEALVEEAEATSPNIARVNWTRKDKKTGKVTTGTNVLRTLNNAEIDEINQKLKGMEPVLLTAMAKKANQLEAGMHMSKSKRTLDSSMPFQSEVYFGEAVPTYDKNGELVETFNWKGEYQYSGRKQTYVNGMRPIKTDPGVAPFITGIHSFDSSIASQVYAMMNALNVHDALGVGLHDVARVGQELNKATYQNMLGYSVANEMVSTLDRVMNGLADVMQDPVLAARIQPKLKALASEMARRELGTIAEQMEAARRTAVAADTQKLNMLAEMQAVGQYATDKGSYLVTDQDRQQALDMIDKITENFSETAEASARLLDELSAATALDLKAAAVKALGNDSVTTLAPATTLNTLDRLEQTPEVDAVRDAMIRNNIPLASALNVLANDQAAALVEEVGNNTRKQSVWGEVGTPLVESDPVLVDALANNVMNVRDLVEVLEATNTDPFKAKLLEMVKRTVPAGMPVNYVTPNTAPDGALGTGVNKSRGWYHQEAGTAGLYVKSPDFVESGINTEMLVHELVHAALAQVVEDHTGKDTLAGKAVAELEALRVQAKRFIEEGGASASKFQNATGNVHELLAWGLTNGDFQQEVLAKLQVKTSDTGFLNGLRKFISTLTTMLFRNNADKALDTGLGLLVANSAGLFREAAKLRGKRDSQTLMYEDAVDHINAMTAVEVLDALQNASQRQVSAAHRTHLRELLDSIVTPLYGAYGAFKEEASANRAITPMDVYLKSLDTGKKPFASAAMASVFHVTRQEGFVLESTQAAMEEAMVNPSTTFIRQALENLYNEAKTTIKPVHFQTGNTPQEVKIAKEKYDFLFTPAVGTGKSKHLSQFAAMGLANEEVRNVLSFQTNDPTVPLASLPWASRLVELFRRVMTKLASLHTKVMPGEFANTALNTLVGELVDIEAKHKKRMLEQKLSGLDQVETAIGNVANNARARVEAFSKLPFFTQSGSPFIRLAGVAINTLAADRVGQVLDHVSKVRDRALKTTEGIGMGIINEMRGLHDGNRIAGELSKGAKAIEKERKDTIEGTIAQVNAAFKDGGSYLTEADRTAITRVFLRTNAQAISSVHGVAKLKELMENPAEMAKFRVDLENQLQALSPDFGYLSAATKDLAYHKVIGGNVSDNLMLNTANIAMLYGTSKAKTVSPVQARAVAKVLEQLLPVYAIGMSAQADLKTAMEVFRTESNRTDHSGIDMVLKLHAGLQAKSDELLFKGTEALRTSAYTPEIHDNHIEVLLVNRSDLDKFEQAGYIKATELQKDPTDGSTDDRVLVTRYGAGQVGLITGALSMTGMHRKGSSPERSNVNLLNGKQITSAKQLQMITAAKAKLVDDLFNRDLSYDPRGQKAGKLVPVMAPDGRIADYRYTMTENNRDALLDRNNAMDQILGTFAGQIVDKVSSKQQNADVVRSMYDQYRADYRNRPDSYALFGKDSTDPMLAEMYRLLSEDTKREIKAVWKSDNMLIPYDQLNMIVGYRKYSLTEAFSKAERDLTKRAAPNDRNWPEQLMVLVARGVWGEKAALNIGKAEDVIQTLVKETKDILVVKNIVTLVGNMVSNLSLLAIEGVSPREMIESHAVAIKGAIDYRKDSRELLQLRQALDIGFIPQGQAAIEARVVELQDRIARNPIKPLIDAGLMPTIVEDVEVDDTRYSYKSRIQKKLDKYTSRVPKLIRNAAKQVYMTHDTSTYKFLSQSTQLSDLVARYAMYTHTMNRARNPLSQADALRQAEESFVNYDLPSHRSIQFLNDTGLVMFTKYYMRIQKTIMRLVKEKPARVLAMIAAGHYISGLQSVTDSSWINRIGNNPFQNSGFGYFGALDELPVIKFLD